MLQYHEFTTQCNHLYNGNAFSSLIINLQAGSSVENGARSTCKGLVTSQERKSLQRSHSFFSILRSEYVNYCWLVNSFDTCQNKPQWLLNILNMASAIAGSASLLHKAISFLSSKSSREIHLKKEQDIAIKSLLKEKDVLAVLPTGFGKSLVFQVFAIITSMDSVSSNGRVLVICPLKSSDWRSRFSRIECSGTGKPRHVWKSPLIAIYILYLLWPKRRALMGFEVQWKNDRVFIWWL